MMDCSHDFDSLNIEINKNPLPRHIALIMDGNRRWAKSKNLPAELGHREGEKVFHKTVETCNNIGIKVLTAYAFSVENWKRTTEEVGILMRLFEFYMKEERKYLLQNKIKLRIIGNKEGLPLSLQKEFDKTELETSHFNGMTLNLAVNYGSRDEIIDAAKKTAQDFHNGKLRLEDLDEKKFSSYLGTRDQCDPDLLIRTSGEMRLSNFLLWQCAYSELLFLNEHWPDFTPQLLLKSILEYQNRNRRFGGS